MIRRLTVVLFLVGPLTVAATDAHASFILSFNGLADREEVLSFYAAGFGSLGSGPGPDFGITFDPNFLAIRDDFAYRPSRAGLLNGPSSIMNVSSGFTGQFSFYYEASDNSGLVTFWSGLDGTGAMLGSIPLSATSDWQPAGTTLYGDAMSVVFSGTPGEIRFDEINDEGFVVPEPSCLLLLGTGLAGLTARFRRRMFS